MLRILPNYLYAALFVLVALLPVACITDAGSDEDTAVVEKVKVGDTLPDFTVVLNDGTILTPSCLQLAVGGAIVFFHTDCPDCQRALPIVDRVVRNMDHAPFVVCISRAEGADAVASYWHAHALSLPYAAVSDRSIYELFASRTIPRIYVVNRRGKVTAVFVEKVDESTLRSALQAVAES